MHYDSKFRTMASIVTVCNNGGPFPILNLPPELRHRIYRLAMPHIIRPQSSLKTVCESKDEQRPSIALFLINKQLHEEICYVLFQYSHFLISIKPSSVACVALQSSNAWDLDQTESVSVTLASSIRHVDIDLEWVAKWSSDSATVFNPFIMNVHLVLLLEYVCEHLRTFCCLQTVRVGWKKGGDLNVMPWDEHVIFILGPLARLQMDFPRVQITVQAIQHLEKSKTGDHDSKAEAYIGLQNYFSELRKDENHSNTVREC